MKIGIYYHAQMDRKAGGDAVFQETIVDELCRISRGHEVYLFSPTASAGRSGEANGARFIKLETGTQGILGKASKVLSRVAISGYESLSGREFNESSPLEKAVLKHRIDLLWFISIWTEKVSIPYIATVWDLAHRGHPCFPEVSVTGWRWGARERHYRELLPRAACVITGTEAGKKEIIQFYQLPEHLVQVVPFPTPQFALSPPAAGAQGAGTATLPDNYLFYPAQFWPHKNHVGLLLALKTVREKYGLDLNLVLTGTDKGNLGYVQEKAKELGLADRVTFFGFVETGFLRELYRNAFALVYPTFFGPDNLPPLEAFALGCPVIASNVSGAEEQMGSAALLFDPKDSEGMACRIKELHDSPTKREGLIKLGRERALSWTAADYVKQVFGIIDDFEPIRRCWSAREPHRHK
jgi:glycosyltransferase involved in cell wall biosynthesis